MKSWSLSSASIGSLGIDLNGLDISGTVDAATELAQVPDPYSLFHIGSSNVIDGSTTDDRTETTDPPAFDMHWWKPDSTTVCRRYRSSEMKQQMLLRQPLTDR